MKSKKNGPVAVQEVPTPGPVVRPEVAKSGDNRLIACDKVGLPLHLASRLIGDTLEELVEDAKRFKELLESLEPSTTWP
ncbi:hypothetical protein ACXZ66_06885 [Corynebacterium sp. S7]